MAYDDTLIFCDRFIDQRSRTHDQMIQTARSGTPMRRRTAKQGEHAGQPFWGCSAYPECSGTRPLPPPAAPWSSAPSDPSDLAP